MIDAVTLLTELAVVDGSKANRTAVERCCCYFIFGSELNDNDVITVVVGSGCYFVVGGELTERCCYFRCQKRLLLRCRKRTDTSLSLLRCRKRTDCRNCWTGGTGLCSPVLLDRTGGIKFIVCECVGIIDKIINH